MKMRINEYNSLKEFTSQYIGEWGPSDGHWLGLDFIFRGNEYRFNTGSMYEEHNTLLPDGREAVFGLYKKNLRKKDGKDYTLLEEFACMEDVLKSTCIEGIEFSKIIMDDDTELVGQD